MTIVQMSKATARDRFIVYFAELKLENERDGGGVNRYREWKFFLNHHIEEGDLPEFSREWACPRK